MPYILALDEGTSSARAIVFNERGEMVAQAARQFEQHYPKPGWVEHDPHEILEAQFAVSDEAIEAAGVPTKDIMAIGITNQRETTVCWDAQTGKAVYNAIVWQDRRTAKRCNDLKESEHASLIREKTGLLPDAYFSATKIEWILDKVPDAQKLFEAGQLRFGTIDSWLLWHLTNGKMHATDATNASRTLLFDINTCQWDDELLSVFSLNRSILPEVHPSDSIFGVTDRFGDRPIPIHGIIGDQQAAAFGQACYKPGMVKNTYGTGCFILMNIGNTPVSSTHKLLTTLAWEIGTERVYALEGAIFSAGASIQWLEQLGIIESVHELNALAKSINDNDDVYIVPAFAGLGAPQWDPDARGTIVGLTRGSGKAHLARAALESMAFQTDDVLQAMQLDSGMAIKEMRVDGGVAQNDFLMQFQSEVSNLSIDRPKNTESTAWGAAAMAGLGAGLFSSIEEIASLRKSQTEFRPKTGSTDREHLRARWKAAVSRALKWA